MLQTIQEHWDEILQLIRDNHEVTSAHKHKDVVVVTDEEALSLVNTL